MLQFETFTGKDNQFYFNLKTEDKVLLKSEGYTSTAGRDNGIESVKKNSLNLDNYQSDENNFNLKASNGQVIATSTIFSNVSDVKKAIELIQKEAQYAEIVAR